MLKIAHRGASGYEPANTLAAFQKAVELGVDMVELDIRTCKTGEAVVIHDKFIASKKIQLKDLTLDELQKIHLAENQRIPTLQQAFAVIPKKIRINIDIKDTKATEEVIKLIENEVSGGRSYNDFLVTTYNPWTLLKISKRNQKIRTSLLVFFLPTTFIQLAARFPNTVSVQLSVHQVSEQTVSLAHRIGLKVYAWVANDPKDIQRLKQMHVDGIITDFPDRI